jgi:hypothetical protein
MPVFNESVGSERQIVTRSQLVSVSWFEYSVGSSTLIEVHDARRITASVFPATQQL